MAGRPKKTGGRFGVLDPDCDLDLQPNKRHKVNNISLNAFPELPSISSAKNPRFVVMNPTSSEKPITSLSPFLLKKTIDAISKEYDSVSQLRDGSLLIFVKSQKIADIFLRTKNLAGFCPITVKLHEQLNQSKGICYAPCLINVAEKEIVSEMKSQGVKDVYKFSKKGEDGKLKPTGLMLFTFDLYQIPSEIAIGFYTTKVTEYIPNPMRCRNCQLLGHTLKRCNGSTKCDSCNLPPHTPEPCTRTMCANCSLSHSSSSKTCPAYKQAKEILTIKTVNKCTMTEARRMYNQKNLNQTPPLYDTFAVTAKKTPQLPTNSINTQASLPGLSQTITPPSIHSNTSSSSSNTNKNHANVSDPNTSKTSNTNIQSQQKSSTLNQTQITKTQHTNTTPSNSSNTHSMPIPSSNSNSSAQLAQNILNNSQNPSNSTDNINTQSTHNTHISNHSNPSLTHSPLSTVTQTPISSNNYFLNVNNIDSDDAEMQ